LLHADPRSSEVGEWSVLAEYSSAYIETRDHDTAKTQLKNIWQNVSLVGSFARATLILFEHSVSDALVTYEVDEFLAQQRGVPLEINIPQRTILTRHYAVIIDKNVNFVERPLVEAFLTFVQSDGGQQILSQHYFRSVTIEDDLFPDLIHPFTEDDLGGWARAYDRLIENLWKTEIEPDLKLGPIATFWGRGE
jgi:ABC-type sulfate transport system substrate-binding protein